jgi:hypothetical protein
MNMRESDYLITPIILVIFLFMETVFVLQYKIRFFFVLLTENALIKSPNHNVI